MNTHSIPLEKHFEEVHKLNEKINSLQEQLDWFKRQIFGKKSEKIITNDTSPTLFDLNSYNSAVEGKTKNVRAHVRKSKSDKSNTISFPDDIPVERVVYDLKETEKFCKETGKELVKIGEDVVQKLAHKPGSYYIKEIVRPKYSAPSNMGSIFMADLRDSFLPRCKADETLLADVLVKKFVDHLPLYRQSEILAREGIQISRQVLSQWVVKCGLALKPLYNELTKYVLESKNVFIDEVPIDMLKPGKGSTLQGYMWVIAGGKESNPASRIYSFRVNRNYDNVSNLLNNYEDGVVHSDKYGAYETMAHKKAFIWCPCWAHIRRKFFEAVGGDSKFTELVLDKIRQLFHFEEIAWLNSPEERLRMRQEDEIPIIDEITELVKDRLHKGSILPKSKFKEALGYYLGLIPFLKNYTKHPFARLDNNVAERAVRPLVLGRKNWLFLGNEEGGEAAAIILSLVQTCKALKINPREYLESIMNNLMSHPVNKLKELLPHNWLIARQNNNK